MRVREATPEDFSAVASTAADAFSKDWLYAWLHPRQREYPFDFRNRFLRSSRLRYRTPGYHMVVAETDEQDTAWNGTHEIAGYAWWEREGKSDAARAWQQDSIFNRFERLLLKATDQYYELLGLDRSEDLNAVRKFRGRGTKEVEGIDEYWHLSVLGVSHRFQRRGVGAMLTTWGMENAQNEGVPVGLSASPDGSKLYRKLGFKAFGTVAVVDGQPSPVFLWEPKGMEVDWGERES